ncbi:hypothetical protein ABVT39_024180 [Epinephelus coioides]
MARVANLCLPGWDEWKTQMLEKRRRRWRERVRARVRVSLWAKVHVSIEEEVEEDDMEEEEAEGTSSEEEKVSQGEEKEEEEIVMRGAEEMEDGGENDVGGGVREDGVGNMEVIEAGGRVDVEEEEKEEENEIEKGVKEDDEDGREVTEADERVDVEEEEKEEENGVVREESEDLGEEESVVEREVIENGEVEKVEEQDVTGTEGIEEEEEDKEKEFHREREKAEELEGGEEEGEDEVEDAVVSERQVRGGEQVEEEDDGEEEHQEQEQTGQYHLAEPFREHMRRTEDENIWQNQEGASREPNTVNETGDVSDSVESDYEDSDLMGSEDEFYIFDRMNNEERAAEKQYLEELEDTDDKSCRNENSILEALTSEEKKVEEDEREKLTDEKEIKSLATQEEELHVDHEKLQQEEEESTDEEDAEHSTDEEAGENNLVKIYCKEDYCRDVFRTLTEYRDSSLLTDLTLTTEDGRSFHVHSPVLAAVSSHIRESIIPSNKHRCKDRVDERKDTSSGVHWWSVSLGPEVDHVGLKAVVDFAYTGHIPCLNMNTLHQIKAAAQMLGAPRVLDLCKEEEEVPEKTGGQKKEERISAADQMTLSLQSIKQLWADRVGCDVILEALGGSLHVHRVILAVCSDYFRGMFTLGMKESYQSCVSLPFLLASELEVLIECSYSGALPLSWSYVFELTSTTLQLQYQPALSLCLDFLHQEINPHSCLDVASFAEAYEMEQLLEVADDFVLRQFQKVACIPKFKDLPAKQLLKYLNSRSLCVPSELVVFKAVVTWIQARPQVRMNLAKDLMKTIHFPIMTFKEFKEVQSLPMWSDHSLAELYQAVFKDFCSNKTQCRIYLPKESLVLIGGEQISEDLCKRSISRELWFGNSLRNHGGVKKAMEWRKLGDMPEAERFNHEVAVLNGQLYVIGGKKYYGIHDTLNSVYRYDPLQNSWESLADMQEKRGSFSVVVLDGKIYAIGGYCDPEYRESVERYCPTENSWSFVWPLDLPLAAHVAKVLQGQIFVSGGLSNNNQHLASMFLYHPETGSTYLANMAKPRARHCMETLSGCLYVAGGITTGVDINVVDQLACEVYNPVADSWTAFTSLPVPHVGAGSVVLEGKFYVLGGYSQEDYSDTKLVHRYDPTTQKWENMGKMPGPNNDIRASLLHLPSHFRL